MVRQFNVLVEEKLSKTQSAGWPDYAALMETGLPKPLPIFLPHKGEKRPLEIIMGKTYFGGPKGVLLLIRISLPREIGWELGFEDPSLFIVSSKPI